ncbi:hypothetical protein AV540_17275 [Brevibacillus parabrevis]|nr:hypothetical protein AV540_17275 [Brevibacillus parabrevis]
MTALFTASGHISFHEKKPFLMLRKSGQFRTDPSQAREGFFAEGWKEIETSVNQPRPERLQTFLPKA